MKISITLILSIISLSLSAQTPYEIEISQWQKELNDSFVDEETSPLDKKSLRKFDGLDYFPINEKYRITAEFVRTPNELPFTMPTTTTEVKVFEKYGEARFSLDGEEIILPLYQSHSLRLKEEYADYLFLPFTDMTNGNETYGGGRYIDMKIPDGDTIIVDFNKAYNPSCAYNENYSCPIPPPENRLNVAITAGEKNFHK